MATTAKDSKRQLVAERFQKSEDRFVARRMRSLVLALVFVVAFLLLIFLGLWPFAICSLFIALIGISNYFAANGHLHRIQKRHKYRSRLIRDFSKLEPDKPPDHGSPDAEPRLSH